MEYVSSSNLHMKTSKVALPVQNVEENSIIMKFTNFLPGFFHPNTWYIRLSDVQINTGFFPLKFKKWFGVVRISIYQQYSIIRYSNWWS